ncbi:MAG: YbfB/YjiJ family MFS transporter, partial [Firmicutes bacterium]|nr:YbfB/YjiJ family MFS transporter [Bacillota bacterium]
GSLWALVGVLSIFSGVLWGVVSDIIGRKYALAIIFSLQAVCYAMLAGGHTQGTLVLSAVIFGLTAWSIPGVVAATCGDYVGPRLAPAALGMVTLCFAVGMSAAPTIAGYLADFASSFGPALFLAAGVAALGSLGSLSLRPPKTQ